MPKENDLEGAQDQGGKHGGQAGMPKPEPSSPAKIVGDPNTRHIRDNKGEKLRPSMTAPNGDDRSLLGFQGDIVLFVDAARHDLRGVQAMAAVMLGLIHDAHIQTSRSSSMLRITGIAGIGSKTAFSAVAKEAVD